MNKVSDSFQSLLESMQLAKKYLFEMLTESNYNLSIYTHLDADGLASGAILGKTFFREKIPFQIRVLKQLEKENIVNLANEAKEEEQFIIFSE